MRHSVSATRLSSALSSLVVFVGWLREVLIYVINYSFAI